MCVCVCVCVCVFAACHHYVFITHVLYYTHILIGTICIIISIILLPVMYNHNNNIMIVLLCTAMSKIGQKIVIL